MIESAGGTRRPTSEDPRSRWRRLRHPSPSGERPSGIAPLGGRTRKRGEPVGTVQEVPELRQSAGQAPHQEVGKQRRVRPRALRRLRRGEGVYTLAGRKKGGRRPRRLGEMLERLEGVSRGGGGRACSAAICGLLYSTFRQTGRLGCAALLRGASTSSCARCSAACTVAVRHTGRAPCRARTSRPLGAAS